MVMIQALGSTRTSAATLTPNGAKEPRLLFAPLDSIHSSVQPRCTAGPVVGPAPGTWCNDWQAGSANNMPGVSVLHNDRSWPLERPNDSSRQIDLQMPVGSFYAANNEQIFQQGVQPSMGNAMMCRMMYTVLPEQTVVLSCDASDDSSYRGGSNVLTAQSLESLSTMAALSSQSLPPMPQQKAGRSPFAVDSQSSLASLPPQKAKGKKIGKSKGWPAPQVPKRNNANDSLAHKVNQRSPMVSMQVMPNNFEKSVTSIQQGLHVKETDEASAPQQSFPQLAKEPSVDPVMLELEGDNSSTQRRTLDWVISSVWPLALTSRGSRILQKALEVGTPRDQLQILFRLEGRIQEAMRSPHGNYVLQKCIEVIPPEKVQFFLDELKGHAVMSARHRFGCRILQRLIEHCPLEQTEDLVDEVLSDVAALCRHQFGNFVLQHILQHGSSAHKKLIADALHGEMIRLAKHRIASHVVSCALVNCALEDVQRLTQIVLADAGQLADLSRREYGSFVVREVNRVRRLHG